MRKAILICLLLLLPSVCRADWYETLDGAGDVQISEPVDGEVLQYNDTDLQWENKNPTVNLNSTYVNVDGDTMTGNLTVPNLITSGAGDRITFNTFGQYIDGNDLGTGNISIAGALFNVSKVGIGTGVSVSSALLQVGSSPNMPLYITGSSVGIGNSVPVGFLTVGTSVGQGLLMVSTSGNVGIGTTAPESALEVWGSITANNTIQMGKWGGLVFNNTFSSVSGLNPTGLGQGDRTLWARIFLNDSDGAYLISTRNNTAGGISMYVFSTTRKIQFYNNTTAANQSTTSMVVGNWYDTAFSWNSVNGTIDFYLNGQPDGTGVQLIVPQSGDKVRIANRNGGGSVGASFDGIISGVKIYNRVITPDEALNLTNNIPVTTGLILDYDFNKTSGTTLTDTVGGNNATISGNVTWTTLSPTLVSNYDNLILTQPRGNFSIDTQFGGVGIGTTVPDRKSVV
jgi:hypothetical protein